MQSKDSIYAKELSLQPNIKMKIIIFFIYRIGFDDFIFQPAQIIHSNFILFTRNGN